MNIHDAFDMTGCLRGSTPERPGSEATDNWVRGIRFIEASPAEWFANRSAEENTHPERVELTAPPNA